MPRIQRRTGGCAGFLACSVVVQADMRNARIWGGAICAYEIPCRICVAHARVVAATLSTTLCAAQSIY
jgi:hypothetical protein